MINQFLKSATLAQPLKFKIRSIKLHLAYWRSHVKLAQDAPKKSELAMVI